MKHEDSLPQYLTQASKSDISVTQFCSTQLENVYSMHTERMILNMCVHKSHEYRGVVYMCVHDLLCVPRVCGILYVSIMLISVNVCCVCMRNVCICEAYKLLHVCAVSVNVLCKLKSKCTIQVCTCGRYIGVCVVCMHMCDCAHVCVYHVSIGG